VTLDAELGVTDGAAVTLAVELGVTDGMGVMMSLGASGAQAVSHTASSRHPTHPCGFRRSKRIIMFHLLPDVVVIQSPTTIIDATGKMVVPLSCA
jgi:hypothetical protein